MSASCNGVYSSVVVVFSQVFHFLLNKGYRYHLAYCGGLCNDHGLYTYLVRGLPLRRDFFWTRLRLRLGTQFPSG